MNIEDVEPNNILVSWIEVIVPCPIGREHQVAGFHQHLFAFDICVCCALCLNHESQGGSGMSVTLRTLAGFD
jgi:hypothetical protein